jgi:ABC-type uncharacterized transport system permease subunit
MKAGAEINSEVDMVNAIGFIAIRITTSGRWLAVRLPAGCSCLASTDTLMIHYGIEGHI